MFSDSLLVHPDFEPTEYLSHILHLPSSEKEQARLARCTEVVQNQLGDLVSENNDDLLKKVDAVGAAQQGLDKLQSSVGVITSSTGRLKHTIAEPAAQVQHKVNQMSNLGRTLELVRSTQRFLVLANRLEDISTSDPPRAAKTLREIEELLQSSDLSGVEVVDKRLESVSKTSAKVRTKAHELLKLGIQNQRQSDIGAALQCFFSFNTLSKVVSSVLVEQKRESLRIIVRELDIQNIMKAVGDEVGKSTEGTKTREVVFGRLEKVLSDILQSATTLTLLWRVLQKKRDPMTQEPIITAVHDDAQLLQDYWSSVSTQLAENIVKLNHRSNLQHFFFNEFPRLYHSLKTFVGNLTDFLALCGFDQRERSRWLQSATKETQERFVQHSLEKQKERIQVLFTKLSSITPPPNLQNESGIVERDLKQETLPAGVNQMDSRATIMKFIQHEVASNQHEQHILGLVLKNCVVSLHLLLKKLQDHREAHPITSISSFSNKATRNLLLHVSIANCATGVFSELDTLISLLPLGSTLDDVAAELRGLGNGFKAISDDIFSFVMSAGTVALTNAVAFVKDEGVEPLDEKMKHFLSRYAMLFDNATPNMEPQLKQLGCSVLRVGQILAAQSRPQSDAARADCTRWLNQLVSAVSLLQLSSRSLVSVRAVKTMMSLISATFDKAAYITAEVDPLVLSLLLFQHVPPTTSLPLALTVEELVSTGSLNTESAMENIGKTLEKEPALHDVFLNLRKE